MKTYRFFLKLTLLAILPCLLFPRFACSESFDVAAKFVASGWMGDGEKGKKYIKLFESWTANPHSPPHCIKIVYSPGPKGWGGIYWQNKANNWGDSPGADFSKKSFKKLVFWARGEKGGEIVEFKAGGIVAPGRPYRDSFEVSVGKVTLTKEWQSYNLDLMGQNLSNVIGGFCWVASESANHNGLTFYLDDIYYE